MKPYKPSRHGEADYNCWVAVPSGDIPSTAAISAPNGNYFAQIVYPVSIAGASSPTASSQSVSGSGTSVSTAGFSNFTIHTLATAVSAGATIDIESSLDNINWAVVASQTITADGVYETALSQRAYPYLRTNIPSYTDGSYTSNIYAN